jgi:hypothetical protein
MIAAIKPSNAERRPRRMKNNSGDDMKGYPPVNAAWIKRKTESSVESVARRSELTATAFRHFGVTFSASLNHLIHTHTTYALKSRYRTVQITLKYRGIEADYA